jgi:acetyltransferase (GNAT) family protein
MENKIILSSLNENDIDDIVLAFKSIGWNKPKSLYENYLQEKLNDIRSVIIAKTDGKFCGYVTMKWKSDYPAFNEKEIPEIVDLNVLPQHQNRGIGTRGIPSKFCSLIPFPAFYYPILIFYAAEVCSYL